MTLSKEQEKQILTDAAALVAERMWQAIESKIDSVVCISINRAAAALDLSSAQTRRLLTEYVDLGGKAMRVSIDQLNRLIKSRTARIN